MQKLRIGEAAKAVGLSTKTIRYYHSIDLVPEPPRTDGDYRLYDADDLLRLWRIRRLRALGLSLDQIRELLAAPATSHADTLRTVLQALDESLSAEIAELDQQRRAVRELLARDELDHLLSEPASADGESLMARVEEQFGALLGKMRPDVLAHERRLWNVIGTFNLPADNQRHIEQMIQHMGDRADALHSLLPLSERFVDLADLPEDAPEVAQLVDDYIAAFLELGLASVFDTVGEPAETTILHETMSKMAMASLSPAQARFFQELSETATATLLHLGQQGETTHAAK